MAKRFLELMLLNEKMPTASGSPEYLATIANLVKGFSMRDMPVPRCDCKEAPCDLRIREREVGKKVGKMFRENSHRNMRNFLEKSISRRDLNSTTSQRVRIGLSQSLTICVRKKA